MIVKDDEINRIAIDSFVSASGLYKSIFCHRYEPNKGILTSYYIVVVVATTRRVIKVVQLPGNWQLADAMWQDYKQMMTTVRPGAVYETDAPTDLHARFQWSPPILIKEDLEVLKMRPVGAQIFVRDITAVDEISARGEAAGIHVVVADENRPLPTMGIILKMGPDPFLQEQGLEIGDIVMFSRHAGGPFTEEGYSYRHIQVHEIIGLRKPADGLEDVLPPNLDPAMIEWSRKLIAALLPIAESKPIQPVTTDMLTCQD